MEGPLIGRSLPRREGQAKVTGRARYVDDFTLPGMLYGATVRSQIARGRILGIDFAPGIPWDEFTIVTWKDIPGENTIVHLLKDHPCLVQEIVNHPEEPIVLLAHPDKALLRKAVDAVTIELSDPQQRYTRADSR